MNPVPMSTLAEHDVIVIDPGSGYIKAGFAGEDIPRVVIPSIAIHLANQAVPAEVSHVFKDLEWVFGYAALDALRLALEATGKQTLAVIRPIERGVIKDWEAFELLIEHVICVSLAVREPALHPLMIAVSPNSRPQTRSDLVEHLFKRLAPPSLYLYNSAVLALFSTGCTTGVVLDIGEGVTSAVPVFEGLALNHAAQNLGVAGADITQLLLAALAEVGVLAALGNNPHAQLDLARTIKERVCICSPTPSVSASASGATAGVSETDAAIAAAAAAVTVGAADFELPDGSILRLDEPLRAAAAEVIFSPARAVTATDATGAVVNPSSLYPVAAAHADGDGAAGSSSRPRGGGNGDGDDDDDNEGDGNGDINGDDTGGSSARRGGGRGGGRGVRGGGGNNSNAPGSGSGGGPMRHFPLPLSLASIPIRSPALQLLAATPAARPADGAGEMLHCAIAACDPALREDLYNCVVVVGGGSLLPGLPLRVKSELVKRTQGRVPVNLVLDMSRKWASWVGASMFASLPTFQLCRVTRAEFEADKTIIHKRYF